jgi:cephalosporin hydroxylase
MARALCEFTSSSRGAAVHSWVAAALVVLVAFATGCGTGEAKEPASATSTTAPAAQQGQGKASRLANQRDLDPALSESEREIIERFALLVSDKKETTFRSNKWLGIPNLQYPTDAWVIQEMIVELKPDFIVETGTYHGGSAAMWAMLLEHVNPKGRVITIDIEDRGEEARKLPIVQERVEFVLGSSIDPEIVAHVVEQVQGSNVLVILDSNHTRKHVLAELAVYAPLVPVGGYVIVQDTGGIMIQQTHPGPRRAVDDFLKAHPEFEADRGRERQLLTMHPNGYLRRKY